MRLVGRMSANVNLARLRKAQKSTGSTTAREWYEVRREIPEAFGKWQQKKKKTSKKEWEW